jgi:CO dehydrogenase/acetyl-CoA synthase beta subunit
MADTIETNETSVDFETQKRNVIADMAPLVGRVREFLAERTDETASCDAPYDLSALSERFGFSEKRKGRPEVILGEDVAVELGHPSTASQVLVLLSHQPELVQAGRISIVGPDLDAMEDGSRHPFAQVVMLAVKPGETPDPFETDNTQYLMHRLSGYMVRSVPGRLWVRISKAGRAAGLTLKTVGSALIAAYTHDFEVIEGAEVVFVTSSSDDVNALSQLSTEVNILAGRHKKLALGVDGEVECQDLNCDTCDEQPVCDSLRDIVIKRRGKDK